VNKIKANLARSIAAVFTVVMLYASVCSSSCAIGVCPEQTRRTAGHDCDQMPSHHSNSSGEQTPDTPDCSQHQHPELFVAKSAADLPQFQLSVADHLTVSVGAFSPMHGLSMIFTRDVTSEHAPPVVFSGPLYDRISVLRI
jgi:hypothetical protein